MQLEPENGGFMGQFLGSIFQDLSQDAFIKDESQRKCERKACVYTHSSVVKGEGNILFDKQKEGENNEKWLSQETSALEGNCKAQT